MRPSDSALVAIRSSAKWLHSADRAPLSYPDADSPLLAAARKELENGFPEKAIDLLSASSDDATSGNLLAYKALALERLGRFDESLTAAEKAVSKDKECLWALHFRWSLLPRLGRNSAMRIEVDAAIVSAKPEDKTLLQIERAMLIASSYAAASPEVKKEMTFDMDLAIVDATQAIENDPSPANYLLRAMVLMQAEMYEACVVDCREALKLDPNNPAPRIAMGIAFANRGRYENAYTELSVACKEHPDNIGVWQQMAEFAWKMSWPAGLITDDELRHIAGRYCELAETKDIRLRADACRAKAKICMRIQDTAGAK